MKNIDPNGKRVETVWYRPKTNDTNQCNVCGVESGGISCSYDLAERYRFRNLVAEREALPSSHNRPLPPSPSAECHDAAKHEGTTKEEQRNFACIFHRFCSVRAKKFTKLNFSPIKVCISACFLYLCRKNYIIMKRLIFIIVFFTVSLSISSKSYSVREAMLPIAWVLPDTCIISPSYCDTVSSASEYTMMMVYKTLKPDTAQQLWRISRQDSTFYAITTHGLYTEKTPLSPRDRKPQLSLQPCIYTMHHTMASDTAYQGNRQLCIGIDTPTDSTQIVLYEAAYFPTTLSRSQSLMFQTYLALKHGITLNKAHYLSTMGDTLWNAITDKRYYHHIKGIGSDSVYNFYSQKSSSLEDDVLTISCAEQMPYNTYALLGDNNAGLVWYTYENTTVMLQRTWKIRTTNNLQSLVVSLNSDKIGEKADTLSLVLLNAEEEILQTILPDSIDRDNNICYTIAPSANQIYFSFIGTEAKPDSSRKSSKANNTLCQTEREKDELQTDDVKVTLYPNPTRGEYVLDIILSQPTDIILSIQAPTGKAILQQKLTSNSSYRYSGNLYTKGVHLFSIYSSDVRLLSTIELLVY